MTTPFERDEGEYAYGAWMITQGGFPYKDTFLQKPPLIIYTYLLGEIVAPGSLWPSRFLAVIFSMATVWVLAKIAQEKIDRQAFWYVLFLYPLLVWSPINSGLAANTEIFMLLPLSVLLWKKNAYLSGMMAALAFLYKPICLYIVVATLMIRIIKAPSKIRYLWQYGLGFVGIAALVMLPVILTGAGRDFWEQVVVFNALYAKQWGITLGPLFTNLKTMGRSFWGVYLLLLAGILILKKNRVWYLFLLLGLLAVFQTTIRHYYLLLVPFFTLISIETLLKIENWKLRLIIYLVLLLSILYPIRQQFGLTPLELSRWIYGDVNPFVESSIIAKKLAEITSEKECVFVAGSEPQILYYAKRMSCTKFNITYPLIIDSSQREKYQTEIESELKINIPKTIVVSTLAHSGLWDDNNKELLDFTKKTLIDYQEVLQEGGLILYVQK